jgi:hypothetical protein
MPKKPMMPRLEMMTADTADAVKRATKRSNPVFTPKLLANESPPLKAFKG